MEASHRGQRLEDLPGVGPGLATRIRAAYGSDEGFWDACRKLDLDRLLHVEGLSERRAFELAAAARGHDELSTTDRARDVRRDLEDLLASHARTSYGKRFLRLLPTLRDAASIETMQARVMEMRDLAERVDRQAVRTALGSLSPFREPTRAFPRRMIVVDDESEEEVLRSRPLDRSLRVRHGPSGLEEARGEPAFLYAGGGELPWSEAENALRLRPNDPLWKFIPELELQWVQSNRSTLRALADLAALRARPTQAAHVLEAAAIPPSGSPPDVDRAAREALEHATQVLTDRLRAVSLQGDQILELLGSGVPRPVDEARRAALEEGRRLFREKIGVLADPFEEGLPLRLDVQELREAKARAETQSARQWFEKAQAAAAVIHAARAALEIELKDALDFDVEFALGCWAFEAEAQPARTGPRLRFEAGRNLRLARKSSPQPIDYELGGEAPVAVLTGANSGGKSTLLELLSQLVILHHWGLPVPARAAEVPLLDELLLFAGLRGADAGALETFLRELFPPIVRPGRKLVLLDEVESMTELEAAGRILGVFLDEVAQSESLCVLVTHLPNEVLAHTQSRVRVDGIDAVGLDEKHNLIVDRQPKLNHRARSTPELILRRVHARSQGPVKNLYERILSSWKKE